MNLSMILQRIIRFRGNTSVTGRAAMIFTSSIEPGVICLSTFSRRYRDLHLSTYVGGSMEPTSEHNLLPLERDWPSASIIL